MKNYHTHTFRCKHAEGDALDYAQVALEKGLTVLGISDHTPESGLFSFVAHPDLFGLTYPVWDENTVAASRDILRAAEELNVPLEINGLGLMKRRVDTHSGARTAYPWLPFWELAQEYKVEVVVSSDAHYPDWVDLGIKEGLAMAKGLGLTKIGVKPLPSGMGI